MVNPPTLAGRGESRWRIDTIGPKEAREEISLIKFTTANMMQNVIDKADLIGM